jgi:hypothetical protein
MVRLKEMKEWIVFEEEYGLIRVSWRWRCRCRCLDDRTMCFVVE